MCVYIDIAKMDTKKVGIGFIVATFCAYVLPPTFLIRPVTLLLHEIGVERDTCCNKRTQKPLAELSSPYPRTPAPRPSISYNKEYLP